MPWVSVHIDDDCLEEFDEDDLKAELERRGFSVAKRGEPIEGLTELEHVEHLVVCGLRDEARREALVLVGRAIGRPL
jgi:hypothetical protein